MIRKQVVCCMQRQLFESWPIPKAVLYLSFPALAGMAFQVLYNMADLIFIGMTGDPRQITVITIFMPISVLFTGVGQLFGAGGASCISRRLGKGDRRGAAAVSSFCVWMTVVMGSLSTVGGLILLPALIRGVGVSGFLEHLAFRCGEIWVWGLMPSALSFAMNQMIRAKGEAAVSMKGMALGVGVNLILDPLLILKLGLGASGAALAALGADLAKVAYFLFFIKKDEVLSLRGRDFLAGFPAVREIGAVGLPTFLTTFILCGSNILMNRMLMDCGAEAVAAFGVASRILIVSGMAAEGLARGAQPLIGYNFASGNMERMRSVIRFSCGAGTVVCTFFAIVVFWKSGGLVELFTNDPEVVWLSTLILDAMTAAIPIAAVEAVLFTVFQAVGQGQALLILSVGKQVFIVIPLLFLARHFFGLSGFILLEPLKEYITFLLAVWLYAQNLRKWRLKHGKMG